MVAVNRSFSAYTQADYDCQRCGAPETEAMKARVRDFIRPYCNNCLEANKHDGHGPGSGLMYEFTTIRIKVGADGKRVEERTVHPSIPIELSPTRCKVCFANYPPVEAKKP